MHRVTLAHWHGGRAPGTEIDVDDDELRQLTRDGRVSTVTAVVTVESQETAATDVPGADHAGAEPPAAGAAEAEPAKAPPKSSRRR
ncbi:hypothetical protein [Streptomyces sp. NPDC046909]|uniref:hypothetical protein n=1 Tax=Streptomyces sp. NPDC046909 TaxID=3155617 RepID=UPI0033E0121C